jgi:acetyl-CoA carboxylase carboxyltransferase component
MHEHAAALNAAQIFEIDDVIDPADTRAAIARTLEAAGTPQPSGRPVDSW